MQRPKILIIDDDPIVRQTLLFMLEFEGYELLFASSGLDGIQKAQEILPDAILLDVIMPGMDGFEVCSEIRNSEILAEVPILMITSMDDREAKIKGLQAGADDFLPKPFDRLELRARLRTITRLDRYRKLLERVKIEQAHRDLQRAYEQTIEGWANVLDLRDQETQGHSQRVKELTVTLCREIGMPEEDLVHARWGALLHDVGKIAIPDSILRKPAKLSDDEWVIMRKHPSYAFDMLYPIEYLRPALDIPYCHHERWDGTGYPRGIQGLDIPLAARIFSIADVWDALTNDRPYRKAWSYQEAMDYILEKAGWQFDPELTEIFTRHMGIIQDIPHCAQAEIMNDLFESSQISGANA